MGVSVVVLVLDLRPETLLLVVLVIGCLEWSFDGEVAPLKVDVIVNAAAAELLGVIVSIPVLKEEPSGGWLPFGWRAFGEPAAIDWAVSWGRRNMMARKLRLVVDDSEDEAEVDVDRRWLDMATEDVARSFFPSTTNPCTTVISLFITLLRPFCNSSLPCTVCYIVPTCYKKTLICLNGGEHS